MSAGMLGFSVTEDLLPALGDTWAVFDAPDHGGILLTGTVLVAEVKDAEGLHGMLTRTVQMVGAMLGQTDVSLHPHETAQGEHRIHYLLIGGAPVPVTPSWGFVNDRFVFGLYPQTVATAMQQVDPKTRGESILDQPDFVAARKLLPREAVGVGYFDSKYFARLIYPLVTAGQTALASYGAEHGLHLDLDILPPLPKQLAGVTNCVGTSSLDDDGVLYASIGDGTHIAVAAYGVALGTSIMLPSLARARFLAKRAVSSANLRGIGQGCLIYANDNQERLPGSLEELIETGMITRDMLTSPSDPDGVVSYVYITGHTASAQFYNVVAYERIRDDEGTNVLFMDGHVEFLRPDEFKRVVRETYERLGRKDEIPPELRD